MSTQRFLDLEGTKSRNLATLNSNAAADLRQGGHEPSVGHGPITPPWRAGRFRKPGRPADGFMNVEELILVIRCSPKLKNETFQERE